MRRTVRPRFLSSSFGSLAALTQIKQPDPDSLGDELRAVVGSNVAWDAAQDEQVAEHIDHVDRVQLSVHPDRQAFTRELVDDVEHAILPPLVSAILDEVVGPDVVRILRPKTDARINEA